MKCWRIITSHRISREVYAAWIGHASGSRNFEFSSEALLVATGYHCVNLPLWDIQFFMT